MYSESSKIYRKCQQLTDELNKYGHIDESIVMSIGKEDWEKLARILVDENVAKKIFSDSWMISSTSETQSYSTRKLFDAMAKEADHQRSERIKSNVSFWLSIASAIVSLIAMSPLRELILRIIGIPIGAEE